MDRNISEFDSEFCNVDLKIEDNVVLITWKKFCCYENYRKPTTFALKLLEQNHNYDLIIDARNGFEDEKEDVEWGFSELLPAMSNTSCKNVVFIMNEVNDIEEEMDMWTKEFMKYFNVKKVRTYEESLNFIRQ